MTGRQAGRGGFGCCSCWVCSARRKGKGKKYQLCRSLLISIVTPTAILCRRGVCAQDAIRNPSAAFFDQPADNASSGGPVARSREQEEQTHSSGGTARPANIYMEMGTPVQKKNIQVQKLQKTKDAWWRGEQDAGPGCRTWEARQDGGRPGPDLSGPLHRLSAECSASRADKNTLSVPCGKCDSSRVQHACSTLGQDGSAPQSRPLTLKAS